MMNCYKSSFQECITIIILKIDRQGTSRHIVYFSYKKQRGHSASPHHPPESVRAYADVRTKIFGSMGLYQICLPMVLRELRYNIHVSASSNTLSMNLYV